MPHCNDTPTPPELADYLIEHFGKRYRSKVAQMLCIDPRTLFRYTDPTDPVNIPYCVWYTLSTKVKLRALQAARSAQNG